MCEVNFVRWNRYYIMESGAPYLIVVLHRWIVRFLMEHILSVVEINEIRIYVYTGISRPNIGWRPYRNFKYSKFIEFSDYWFSFNCNFNFITTETRNFKLLLYLKYSTEFSNILLALYSLTIVCIYLINQSLVLTVCWKLYTEAEKN